jgi:hypothetical protein
MADPKCPYCGGSGEVSGVLDDVELRIVCVCSGGDEESVRWLLQLDDDAPPGPGFIV